MTTLVFGLPDQRVRIANEAVAELIRFPQSAIVGLRLAQVWDGEDGRRAHLALSGLVPDTAPTFATRSVGAFFEPEALDLDHPVANGSVPGSYAEGVATFERHLLDFAAELHAGDWGDAQPPAVDTSRFAALDELPMRQREIVDLLLRGQRIPSIAASMYISASTVRNHLSHVFSAFGVHSQAELPALLRSGSDGRRR